MWGCPTLPRILLVLWLVLGAQCVELTGNPSGYGIIEGHQAVIITVLGCTAVFLLGSLLYCLHSRGLRLAMLCAVAVWVIVLVVGLVAWGATVTTSREVILTKSVKLLSVTAESITTSVVASLELGKAMPLSITRQTQGRLFSPNTTDYVAPTSYMHGLMETFGKDRTLAALFYGTEDGVFYMVEGMRDGKFQLQVTAGGPLGHAPPPWANCRPYYDNVAPCPSCSEPGVLALCPAHCGGPPSWEACDPTRGLGPQVTNETNGLRMIVGTLVRNSTTGTFVQLAEETITKNYDPRLRPWYVKQNDGIRWTAPYVFAEPVVPGITSSIGLMSPSGEYIGVVAIDYNLITFSQLLIQSIPTPDSLLVLLTKDLDMLASSLSFDAVAADTQVDLSKSVVHLPSVTAKGSRLRGVLDTVLNEHGSVAVIMDRGVVFRSSSSVYVTFPVAVDGLSLFTIMQVPYADLFAEADRASTFAVLCAIAISLVATIVLFACIVFTLRPIKALARDMERIAWMNLDNLSTKEGTRSLVTEIAWLQASFDRVTANLTEFRQYIPHALMVSCKASESGEFDVALLGGDADGLAGFHEEAVDATIVFTDIKGSTQCWEGCPDGMRVALRTHNRVIRDCIKRHSGYEVKTIGDSFMVAFDDIVPALRFSLEVQEALLAAQWPQELLALSQCARSYDEMWAGLSVRIGVNQGSCTVETSPQTGRRDFYGHTVNKAARLESNCIGGAVCLANCVFEQVSGNLESVGSPVVLRYGKVRLKGIEEEAHLVYLLPQSLSKRRVVVERMMEERRRKEDIAARSRAPEGMEESIDARSLMSSASTCSDEEGKRRLARSRKGMLRKRIFGTSLERRTGALGTVEMRFSGGLVDDFDDPSSRINDALSKVMRASAQTNGSVFACLGNAVALGWCASPGKPAGKHGSSNSAMDSSFRFASALFHTGQASRRSLTFSVGLCYGTTLWGNLGADGQRFFTTVSPCQTLSAYLAQSAIVLHAFCLQASLLCGGGATPYEARNAKSAKGTLPMQRPVDEWIIIGVQKVIVYELGEYCADAPAEEPQEQHSTRSGNPLVSNPASTTRSGGPPSGGPPSGGPPSGGPGSDTNGEGVSDNSLLMLSMATTGPLPGASPLDMAWMGGGAGPSGGTPSWGWREGYVKAFFERRFHEIRQDAFANDAVARRVANMLERKGHLREPIIAALLDQQS
eukprot:Rhum_TRINITY_DN12571_c1_g1::Rhum_TRINITY_DN12571_c1_g1_i1::g.53014::m.53014